MSKKTSTVHYNEDVRNATIELFLKGKSNKEIERAIHNMIRAYQNKRGK
jgi:hypothetical protein